MTGRLSATTMARLQAITATSFDQVATIQRSTPTTSAHGLTVDNPVTVPGLSAVPCRVATPNTPQLVELAAKMGEVVLWRFTCAAGTDLRIGDRVLIGSDTLRVLSIETPQSYTTATQALCGEVR